MHRKFLTKTARSQGQAILFFRAPFSLVTVDNLAEMAEKFTRNEILNSNEVRALLGYKPVNTPRADELLNKNINPVANDPTMNPAMAPPMEGEEGEQPLPEQPPEEDVDTSQNQNPGGRFENVETMDQASLQSYLQKLEAYSAELDELDKQVDEA